MSTAPSNAPSAHREQLQERGLWECGRELRFARAKTRKIIPRTRDGVTALLRFLRGLPLVAAGLCVFAPSLARAQSACAITAPRDSAEWIPLAAPNSEDEVYLRHLQIAGLVRAHLWSVRGFSMSEWESLSAVPGCHPWTRTPRFRSTALRRELLPVTAELRLNSSFPYGSNDGAVWAGRGLTASVTAGIAARSGPISAVLAPMAFISQNASFDIMENGFSGPRRFADGVYGGLVDRPQRFGDKPYGRLDLGNSMIRVDFRQLAFGASTAPMSWGPSERYPFILGSHAPGFAHLFLGTTRPVNVWLARIHARMIWGRLDQSAYSPAGGGPTYVSQSELGTRRFATGLVVAASPRGIHGMELGVARFFHLPWPREGISPSYVTKPFESILKGKLRSTPGASDPGTGTENQLVSGFARWAFPSAGLEVYGEYGREDHSWDARDFVQEPDHSRSYGLGIRKSVVRSRNRLDGLSFELINFQLPTLARTLRGEGSIYIHRLLVQGHTHRGQLLGADVGVGAAAASSLTWQGYAPQGRTSVALHRIVRQERGLFHEGPQSDSRSSDVQYALEAERTRNYSNVGVTLGLALIHNFNRNFTKDVTGGSIFLRTVVPFPR